MKRNFIIFFTEKEGTSPLVRLLDNFHEIAVVHQEENAGWEPFDEHNCGPMSLEKLGRCLDIVFGDAPVDMDRLNEIYTQTSKRPLEKLHGSKAVGFKMRFRPPKRYPNGFNKLKRIGILAKLLMHFHQRSFHQIMIRALKKYKVTVLLAIRQDVLRWALSKYHGDGTGKHGHIQFRLASGTISKAEIEKFHVDCLQLEEKIIECEKIHMNNRQFLKELKQQGIPVYPVLYEEFLNDKQKYFNKLLTYIGMEDSKVEISNALERGAYFKKVHSNNLHDMIENPEEVLERFGNRYVSWS